MEMAGRLGLSYGIKPENSKDEFKIKVCAKFLPWMCN
jgi:hypothetical protein